MSYKVLVTFTEARRDYLKGSVQSFSEWTEEQMKVFIPKYEDLNYIAEIPAEPVHQSVVVDVPQEQAE